MDRRFGAGPFDRESGDCRHGGHQLLYSREKTDFVIQHAKLQAELRKAREEEAHGRNGKPGTNGNRKV